MVPEFLIRRLGERCLFAEVGGEVALGLKAGIKSGLDEGAQGDGAACGQGVAIVSTCHSIGSTFLGTGA